MKQLKDDIKSGMSKEEAFESYKQRGGDNTKKASTYLSYRPDPQLLRKYSIANYVLIFLFSLRILAIAFTSIGMLINSSYLGVLIPVFLIELGLYIAVLFFLFRGIAGAYFAVIILTMNPLIKSIGAFLNETSMATVAPMVITALVIVLAIYIKLKLFPFQSFLHGKKDSDGNRIFNSTEQVVKI